MGNIFKHLNDLDIIKRIFPNVSIEEGEEDVVTDQVGKGIKIMDGAYELYASKGVRTDRDILGTRKRICILWTVITFDYNPGVHMYPDGSGEPPSWDDRELIVDADLRDAIKAIADDMFRIEYDGIMEQSYFEDQNKEEELNPEEAYPQCMEK